MIEPTPWHRLFGLSWVDFFRGMPVRVELEKDLSLKLQLLDVILIRTGAMPLACRLPDGFEVLTPHNLISFKSYQEALDGWALNELIGYYVNYRKQVSTSMQDLLPESHFRLFAVSVRFPQSLARQVTLTAVQPGVYDVRHFTGNIRVVVVHELPQHENNAMLHLFSARMDLLRYGTEHYRQRSEETSTLLRELFKRYRLEATLMPDALELFTSQKIKELVNVELSPVELLAALSPETRAALAQLLKNDDSLPNPAASEPEPGKRKQRRGPRKKSDR